MKEVQGGGRGYRKYLAFKRGTWGRLGNYLNVRRGYGGGTGNSWFGRGGTVKVQGIL